VDNKFHSRKYRLTLLALLVFIITFLLGGIVPAVASLYSTLVGAVLGLVGLYSGSNIIQKKIAKLPNIATGGEETIDVEQPRGGDNKNSGENNK